MAGFFLGKSQFSKRIVFIFGLVYGLFVVGFFAGVLLPGNLPWHERIPEVVGRQVTWITKAANVVFDPDAADTSRDGLIFVMHTGTFLWILGFAAAWYTFRNLRIWRVILPNGVLLLITVAND